jgi:hypothetical protein
VAERLVARRTEIEDAIFTRVSDVKFTTEGGDDAAYIDGLRMTVTAVLGYGLSAIERGGECPTAVPRAALAQARRAARARVELGTVLRRYVAGQALLEDFMLQEALLDDLVEDRIVLRGVLETSSLLLDRLLPSITDAYTDEIAKANRWPRKPDPDRIGPPRGARRGHDPEHDRVSLEAVGTSTSSSLPEMLGNPRALRARQCVLFLADHPGSSNNQIAEGAGIAHASQVSKLLSELHAAGLLVKRSEGAGRRNVWQLTAHGEDVARSLPAQV